jgi:hypothetical protein
LPWPEKKKQLSSPAGLHPWVVCARVLAPGVTTANWLFNGSLWKINGKLWKILVIMENHGKLW